MHKLIYFNEKNEKIVFKENITNEDVEEFLKVKDDLRMVMNSIDYYNIVRENIIDLMNAITEFDMSKNQGFVNINRHLFNMLSSFYSYVKFYERFYHDKYKVYFSEQFDTYETYKIVSELRKYTTHCYLAITRATLDLITGKISIQIVPEELLKNDSNALRSDMKEILKRMVNNNEKIDLRLLTNDFLNIFTELQIKIMNRMKEDIFEYLEIIEKYLFGNNMNKKESYIELENGECINTSNIFFMFFDKLEKDYKPTQELIEKMKKMNDIK